MDTVNTIEVFYSQLMEEVQVSQESSYDNWTNDDFFTQIMLEYLEDAGEALDTIMCPYKDRGVQMNAYSIAEDYSSIDMFVSIYNDNPTPKSVSQTDVDAAIRRAVKVYQKATTDLYQQFSKDNDMYEFASSVKEHAQEIKNVKIIALTNGLVKPVSYDVVTIGEAEVSFMIWDIDRLYRCEISGKMRETIEIDFDEKFGLTIPCIENISSDKYSVYLAILDGELLAKLYGEYRERLLEKNVRSFLQVKGDVNKGIKNTLLTEPEMFLAYNNGISVTAESVEIVRDENGKPSIKKIRDMQIVNGGQTTASIFNVYYDKKVEADLSKVFVQMKLSVIKQNESLDVIVSNISKYANTQNKVQIADFSANDPYHRKIEELSRTIWTIPTNGGASLNWFYERVRGQYADMIARESTPLRKKKYKAIHPMFTKTDLAKYENTWDQLPYHVSEGAQKNFKRFTVRVTKNSKFVPDEKYYQNLIAKAIMFKRTEKLVHQQQYGGYRANIVTYTLSFLSFKSAQRINLEKIWKEQALSPALENAIIEVSKLVHDLITNPPGGANVGEWCKKEKCWDKVKEIEYTISKELQDEMVDVSYTTATHQPTASVESTTEEDEKLIAESLQVKASTYFALSRWAKQTNNFQPWQRSLLFTMGTIVSRGKKPSIKQAKQALKALKEGKEKGFIEE